MSLGSIVPTVTHAIMHNASRRQSKAACVATEKPSNGNKSPAPSNKSWGWNLLTRSLAKMASGPVKILTGMVDTLLGIGGVVVGAMAATLQGTIALFRGRPTAPVSTPEPILSTQATNPYANFQPRTTVAVPSASLPAVVSRPSHPAPPPVVINRCEEEKKLNAQLFRCFADEVGRAPVPRELAQWRIKMTHEGMTGADVRRQISDLPESRLNQLYKRITGVDLPQRDRSYWVFQMDVMKTPLATIADKLHNEFDRWSELNSAPVIEQDDAVIMDVPAELNVA